MKKNSTLIFLFISFNLCEAIQNDKTVPNHIKKSHSDENLQNARIVNAILGAPDNASHSDLAVLYHAWNKIKFTISQRMVNK